MQIQVNTDKTITRHTGLDEHVQSVVSNALQRFGEQITRVEVHLSDNLGQKSADGDNRCLMEARLTGLQPIAVSDHAATLHQAISGATEKLKRSIDSAVGKLHDSKRHADGVGSASAAAVANEAE
ncbi:Sigma 54 modulation protein / S30EA ribosomal protein [Duganella sacchari]|uniref:Sigma 54 modulation protein / S30EA ribosomal protein n=1 Tax=Duganella sacchari TaxID=551987 RepID=A0A1M7R296_9BURK|nr:MULTISPECIES: HPF/RaiA family ribosome-associated protein [Duganella]MYM32147.1 HPF/RaiA family ribosome-associated protein [Duganella sp. CY15W]SHN39070.1 Sigma 54 modulation protein / S30EA ribosomal protein [Duganella sacchari]